jgi:hypothetical protein
MLNIVNRTDTPFWDSIKTLVEGNVGPLVASQHKPDTVAHTKWCQNISPLRFTSGEAMANRINQILSQDDRPQLVMIDELRTDTVQKIHACARRMRTAFPVHRGRWGAYLVNGTAVSYARLNPAIDALLAADAILACEMYARESDYCAAADPDKWLEDFFLGSQGAFPQPRFHWLAERKASRRSASRLTVLFGVTNSYIDNGDGTKFLDRMFYIWATRSGYRAIVSVANGGAGSWKWESGAIASGTRDLAFAGSWNHYCREGLTSSRMGALTCSAP